jgi:hypothetical protein
MEQKDSKIFNKSIMQAVSAFCDANNIEDKDDFIYLCFKQGFNIKKYGLLGKTLNEGEKDLKTGGIEEKRVEIEVIREIRVEIPVEVIKEVEKIVEVIREVEKIVEVVKEVTVEKEVIKEVPVDRVVEKIIYTTDDIQINELGGKIAELEEEIYAKTTEIGTIRQEFSTKTEETENIFQNEISKKDEELDELRRTLDEKNNNDKSKLLQETLQNLRGDLQQKNEQIRELEKINRDLLNGNQNQAYLLRGSNLNKRV